MKSENNVPIEHQNVPADHQGLHSFLYGSDDEHCSNPSPTAPVNDESEVVPVGTWRLAQSATLQEPLINRIKVAGVYAVLDSDRQTQYIGYSRDVQQSLEGHIAQNGVEVCAFIRVQTFKVPKRQAMEALQNEWIAALDQIPPGNREGQGTWARTIGEAARATQSASERNAYEDKKLKLRKAMADTTLVHGLEQSETLDDAEAERRRNLETAIENDDWSAVVES